MNFAFTDEQLLFRRTVRDFLEKECPPELVRAAAPDEPSFELWRGLADLGVVGLTVPEERGGLGKNEVDLVLLLEEAGRAALPLPLAETAAVVVPSLVDLDAPEMTRDWLDRISSGRAVAGCERAEDGSLQLVFTTSDKARHRMAIAAGALLEESDPVADRAAFATAAVLCGIADKVIELGASYAKERHQFGKPIGSFQAVKHLLADALLGLEFARPAVYRAAWSIANDLPAWGRDASMAKALASDAAFVACRAALQTFGAIGYTHEHDLHLWLTKGFALANEWGSSAWHRERIARGTLDQ
jgi:alkylation response protein AidB-like acyl-CoA dehydrogenase